MKREALARRRRATGFTQEALADALGVERSTADAGSPAPPPRPRFYGRPARLLHVTGEELDQLLAGTPEFTPRADRVGHGWRNPSSAGLLLVADLRSRREDLTARYDVVPSATMLGEAAERLHQVCLIGAGAPAGRVQRELHAVQAEAAVLMGQLAWDASQREHNSSCPAH